MVVLVSLLVLLPTVAMAAVWTDKADYTPGSVVTISGDNSDNAGYLPDEVVDVSVLGPNGYTATCNGVADDLGAWSCTITLWDTLDAVGDYTYTATGRTSLYTESGAFTDAAGSYSLNFTAADPKINNAPYLPTYTKVKPSQMACPTPSGSAGRAADPLTHAVFGNPKDSVESLAPPDMALGQIVPFEVKIAVSGSTTPENGVILFTPYWLTKVTSGGDFGYDPAYEVYCAFVDTADAATVDPGANAKVDSWTDTVLNVGTSNEQIQGTFQISGLDSGDSVIVEIWVVLKSIIPAGISGNVQSGMGGAQTAAGATINTGNQTVPLLQVGSFFTADADVSVTKSDTPDPVTQGQPLTYNLTVTNSSTTIVANGVVVTDNLDPSTTFVSGTWPGGGTCTAASGVVTCNLGALAPQQSVTITIVTNVSATAPTTITTGTNPATGTCTAGSADLCNRVSVTAITDDPNTANNSDSEPTNVLSSFVPAPGITINKTTNGSDGPTIPVGSAVTWSYVVTNSGNVPLTNVGVTDNQGVTVTCPKTTLAVLESMTCTASGTAVAGSYSNIGTATGAYNATTVTATDPSSYFGSDPRINVAKTSTTTEISAADQVVPYTFTVTNTGNVPLTGVTVSDPMCTTAISGPTGDANGDSKLDTNETWIYTCNHKVTQDEIEAGGNLSNTVTVDSNETGPDTDTLDIPVTRIAALTVEKSSTTTSLSAAGTVTYSYLVTNTGNVALTGITLSDDNDNDDLSCPFATLAVGASMTCTATHTFTQAELDANGSPVADSGVLYNEVTADSNQTEAVTDDLSIPITYNPMLNLVKTGTFGAGDDGYANIGELITYTFEVCNTGNVTLNNVTVTDPLVTVVGGPTVLDVGECDSTTFTATYAVSQADIDTGSVYNLATADSDESDPDTDTETVPLPQNPAIDIQKTPDSQTVIYGETATFTIVVKNTGNVTLTDVAVTDPLAPDCDATIGTLAVDEEHTYTCTVENVTAGFTNVATATGKSGGTTVTDNDNAVVVVDVLPDISVDKTTDPTSVPETGDDVTFTFVVTNNSTEPFILNSLVDDILGDLDGQGTCEVPQTIAAGESYTCTVTKFLESDTQTAHTNTVTAAGVDEQDNPDSATDDATVTFTDVAPLIRVTKTASPTSVPETGGNVTFTFVVANSGVEPVTLTTLVDDTFGDLNGKGDCVTGGLIPVGGSYSCSITEFLSSDNQTAHINVVTATAVDNDNTPATDTDNETVTFTDVAPAIEITKTASPTSVPETGGSVTFTFLVKNIGQEDVTLTSLSDTVFGDLDGKGTCDVPQTILIGDSYSCEYTVNLASDSLTAHTNVVTATAVDDDNTPATDTDDETVTFTDVAPAIQITKTAAPTSVPETGGSVTFTFTVENTSSETVTILSLTDSVYGPLDGDEDCKVGTVLAAGATCEFAFTEWVEGDYSGLDHVNAFTAVAEDNDGTDATDTDDATVDFTDVAPTILVEKTPSVNSVPETGGSVTFTFKVTNTSSEEPVTITSLVDTVYGTLDGNDDCKVGTVLAAGASCEFSFTKWVEGNYSGPDHVNVFTAVAEDNDGTDATDDDDATVDFTDVAPTIDVSKTANPTVVLETGGNVLFTFQVTNTSSEEPVTITALTDSVYGPLDGDEDCEVGDILVAGGTCTFTLTQWVEGDYSGPDHVNTFTAKAVDDDGTEATDTDDATVDFTNVAPAIEVTKTADPTSVPETGGSVTFTFTVKNTSTEEPVTITALTDSVYGTLDGDADCKVGTVLAAGASCEFSFTKWVEGDFSGDDHFNEFTAVAEDNDGTDASDTDDATVDFTDVAPTILVEKTPSVNSVPETGGDVTFTFKVTNTSSEESVTILSLVDDVYGTLVGQVGVCEVGTVLAAGASCEFSITREVEGNYSGPDHVNVFTAVAEDNDGTDATDNDDATVDFTDVAPTIDVTKTANPTAVLETGGDVLFTFTVTNTSSEEPVTILSLEDSVYGTLAGDDDCKVGTTLLAGGVCTFTLTQWVEGDYSGPDHVNAFTAKAVDDDGTEATDTDDATVDFTNVAPAIDVTKTANPTAVPETGGNVTFTFTVKNTSTEEPVTITSLVDSVYGTLAGDADCAVDTVLAAGASCEFAFTKWVEGDFSGSDHVNAFTAKAVDNDNTEATDSDDATVDFTNVLPTIEVTKTANPTAVPEYGDNVTFTFVVKNTSTEEPVTITALTDSVYGTLDGNDDCKVGTVLAAGASCEFSFTKWVEGDFSGPDHINLFTAKAVDNDNTEATDDDNATVDFTNDLPIINVTKTANPTSVPETGGDVTFTFVVKNTSPKEAVTITSLVDTVYGPLAGDADCAVDTVLAAGASCEFSFTKWVEGDFSGPDHVNAFTAKAVDNDNTEATDDDDETVNLTDVLPDIAITKSANPTSVPETGGNVIFTIVVTNNSSEDATISSLSDDVYGPLDGDDDCKVGTVLAAGASCEFAFTKFVAGDFESGKSHKNTATVVASDDDGNTDTATDDATVTFTDLTADIDVEKYVSVDGGANWADADSATGPYMNAGIEPQFKFVVTNKGNVTLSNIELTDTDFSLAGCTIPSTLAAGASFECIVTGTWAADQHTNTATASGSFTDGAGNVESDSDTDDANYFGSNPEIDVEKYVSIDGGTTWVDADSATGPYLNTGTAPQFKFVVTNTGNVTLSSVTVTDSKFTLPTGCIVSTLAVGASDDCIVTGTWAAGQHKNTATASGSFTDGAGKTEKDTDTDDANYFGADPKIDLTKTGVWVDGNGNGYADVGETINYTFVVKNTGNVALSSVTVTDPKVSPISCPKTTLAVNESMNCTGSYKLTLADIYTGKVDNTATAYGSFTDGNNNTRTVNDPASATVTLPLEATGAIRPTQTTCQQFRDGTDKTMQQYYPPNGYVYYMLKGKTINNINPGVFFYYSEVTLAGGSFTIDVTQSNDKGWPKMPTQVGDNIILWDSNCNKVQSLTAKFDPATGKATLSGSVTGGVYYISVKWQPSSTYNKTTNTGLVGYAPSGKPMVTYSFQAYLSDSNYTGPIASSGASQVLASKK